MKYSQLLTFLVHTIMLLLKRRRRSLLLSRPISDYMNFTEYPLRDKLCSCFQRVLEEVITNENTSVGWQNHHLWEKSRRAWWNLSRFLKWAAKYGLKFNHDNNSWSKDSVTVFGYLLSKRIIKADLRPLQDFPLPCNRKFLKPSGYQSFLRKIH